jgi:hypothetical protein
MVPSEIISKFKQRTLELDCIDMTLVQNQPALPISYEGKGYIRQSTNDRLEFKIYAIKIQNTDVVRHLKSAIEGTREQGGLFRDNEYYCLSATTTDGTVWTADGIIPRYQWDKNYAHVIVTGELSVLSAEESISETADFLQLNFFDDTEIPAIHDRAEFTAVNFDFVINKLDNEFVVEVCTTTAVFPADLHIRIEEALRFLLARSVAWRVIIRRDGGRQRFELASATPRPLNTRLGWPIAHSF